MLVPNLVSAAVLCSACAAPAAHTAPADLDVEPSAAVAAPQPADDGPLLWAVFDEHAVRGYLFGTIHLGVDADELDPVVWRALDRSGVFAMEADIGAGSAPGGTAAQLSAEDFHVLTALAGERAGALAQLPAWQLYAVVINLLYPTVRPLDLALADAARRRGAAIEYLEETDTQLASMATWVNADDVRDLLEPAGEARRSLDELVRAYRRGDLAAVEHIADAEGAEREQLLDRRNHAWMGRLVPLLRRGDMPVFIAVGAAHLPGNEGLLALLERSGFRVARVAPER